MIGSKRGITQEQYQNPFQLLQQVKISTQRESSSEVNISANCAGIAKSLSAYFHNSHSLLWIIDSGASEHMTSDSSILFNIKTLLKPVFVNLPNSQRIKVTKAGSVNILPEITIENVLFVPSFRCNLMPVHKLCRKIYGLLIFTSLDVVLQPPSMKRPVLLGRES